jgi:hypothetical protein
VISVSLLILEFRWKPLSKCNVDIAVYGFLLKVKTNAPTTQQYLARIYPRYQRTKLRELLGGAINLASAKG